MDQRVWLMGLPLLIACTASPAASGMARAVSPHVLTRGALARAAAPPARPAATEPVRVDNAELSSSAHADESDAASDQAYLDNTRRAVELYRKFIELAGADPSYAQAVQRSREQIEDLTSAGVFVGQGMKERAGK